MSHQILYFEQENNYGHHDDDDNDADGYCTGGSVNNDRCAGDRQVSILSSYYAQLFHTKVLCLAFLCLQFGFKFFWQENISAKAARKMLMKLTTDQERAKCLWSRQFG